MRSTPWGTYSKATQERYRQERESRNQDFVKQQIPLPSGATFTICHPGNAAALDSSAEA